MLERSAALSPGKVFEELRRISLGEKCKIIEEDPPKRLIVEKDDKQIRFDLIHEGAGTRIMSDTSYTFHAGGIILLGILTGFLWWLVSDMKAYIQGLRGSLAGWFLELFGYTGFRQALALINIFEILTYVIAAITILGIIYEVYRYSKRETVANRILSLLPRK